MYILLSLVCLCSLKLASFQGPRPASRRLQHCTASNGKLGEGLGMRLHQSKLAPKLHWDCKFGHNTPVLKYSIRFFFFSVQHTPILPNDMLPGRERERILITPTEQIYLLVKYEQLTM